MHPKQRLKRLLTVAVAIAITSGCAGSPVPRDDRDPEQTTGPLVVSGASAGKMTLHRHAGFANRRAVFGGLLLCTTGAPVTIDRVRYRPVDVGESVEPVLRLVPEAGSRVDPGSGRWAPVSAWRGNLFGARLGRLVPGGLTRDLKRTPIAVPCGPPSVRSARVELLTSVAGGAEGVAVRDLAVDYRAGDQEFTVEVPWSYILCGEAGTHKAC